MTLKIINIDTPSLGDRSYLVHDGKSGVVIDPQRDIDRINLLLSAENVELLAVVETHIHNDYISGGLELSRHHSAQYWINGDDDLDFDRQPLADQEIILVGTFSLKALHTPGHTFTHISYQLIDSLGKTVGIFSGGSLLHGATGRPDLLGWDKAEELTGMQHHSAQMLAESLTDEVNLYPTHGFGSFCSATPTLSTSSTIGDERKINPVLLMKAASYIEMTLAALDVYPSYFDRMGSANSKVSKMVDLSELREATAVEILDAMKSGAWLVDLRDRKAWADLHVLGSVSLGVDGSLASYLGWLYPYEKELFLLSDHARDIATAQRELVRIGIDRPNGYHLGHPSNFAATGSIKVVTFLEVAAAQKNPAVSILDVRQVHERAKSYIEGSLFIPFYEVESRVGELSESREIWVHCASGYRAASILGFIESSGRTPVLINDDYSKVATFKEIEIIYSDITGEQRSG